MDTSTIVVIVVIAVVASSLVALLFGAHLRSRRVNGRRRAAAAGTRDDAAGIELTIRTHDAEAEQLAARAQRDRLEAGGREEEAARRADKLDPDVGYYDSSRDPGERPGPRDRPSGTDTGHPR